LRALDFRSTFSHAANGARADSIASVGKSVYCIGSILKANFPRSAFAKPQKAAADISKRIDNADAATLKHTTQAAAPAPHSLIAAIEDALKSAALASRLDGRQIINPATARDRRKIVNRH